MNHTILIPTDFSRVCSNAINHGAEIARNMKAKLVILHVVNADSLSFMKKNKLEDEYIDERLDELKIEIESSFGIKVFVLKKYGKLIQNISEVSEEVNADLVVLGTHGKTGIQVITGSHAMKVIHALKIPVLVVQKRTIGMGYRKIVFPINVSTDYDVKIDWTIFIANTFRAEVLIYLMKTDDEKIKMAMSLISAKLSSVFKAHQIKFTIDFAEKSVDFPKQINQYAVENSADLIMIKVDNDEFEPSFILGALEEKMIFNSHQIPVFCAQKKN